MVQLLGHYVRFLYINKMIKIHLRWVCLYNVDRFVSNPSECLKSSCSIKEMLMNIVQIFRSVRITHAGSYPSSDLAWSLPEVCPKIARSLPEPSPKFART